MTTRNEDFTVWRTRELSGDYDCIPGLSFSDAEGCAGYPGLLVSLRVGAAGSLVNSYQHIVNLTYIGVKRPKGAFRDKQRPFITRDFFAICYVSAVFSPFELEVCVREGSVEG